MKKSFWKKLAIVFSLGIGVLTLGACESTDKSASRLVPESTQLSLIINAQDGKKYVQGVIGIRNDTIYNVKSWDVNWQYQDPAEALEKGVPANTWFDYSYTNREFGVAHGASGGVVINVEVDPTVTSVKLISGVPNQFYNLWESYLGWWIATIVIVAVALIFFGAELFGRKMSKAEISDVFKGHVASTVVFSLFMLIICLFPLIFGSWFSTIILLIALAGSVVGAGALAALAMAVNKE